VWTRREVLRAGVLAAGLSAVGEPESGEVLPTGIEAVDAALGGGFSLGRVVAVAGPPGLTALTFVRHVVAHAPWRRLCRRIDPDFPGGPWLAEELLGSSLPGLMLLDQGPLLVEHGWSPLYRVLRRSPVVALAVHPSGALSGLGVWGRVAGTVVRLHPGGRFTVPRHRGGRPVLEPLPWG
jgi:hypothetical protein